MRSAVRMVSTRIGLIWVQIDMVQNLVQRLSLSVVHSCLLGLLGGKAPWLLCVSKQS